jgi:hypothetical protein
LSAAAEKTSRSVDFGRPIGACAEGPEAGPTRSDQKALRESAKRNGEIMGSARPSAVGTLKFEDEEVRITEWRFAPGAATGWHRHGLDYAVVPLLDGRLQVQHPDGSTSFADLKRGMPYGRSEGVEHDVINANAFDYAFLEIELKKRAQS